MFDIVVVTTKKRKSLITEHLNGIEYTISITPDYDLPKDFKPTVTTLTYNHLGTYRCFRGHQDAIAKATKDYVLVLEDDAVPNCQNWYEIIYENLFLMNIFDMISFHGRGYDRNHFDSVSNSNAYKFIRPKNSLVWVVAALAYVIGRKDYERIKNFVYDGTPWDMLLYRNFDYCLIEESPFNHDRSEGSLVD